MAEFETGPSVFPGFVRDVLAAKLRRSTLYPDGLFDKNGCFGILSADFSQGTYFSAKLLGFDPSKNRLYKSVDRTYYVIPENVAENDEDGFIGKLRISASNALQVPFDSMRPVVRALSGVGMVNEDGDLYLQLGQLASERFTMRVESSHMGSPLYRVVFDEIQINETRRYIKPDGVAILIDDMGQRRLVPRQIKVNS